ncbi:hypothetical protein H2201_008723 [Coniosporium apollinis]|uniref:Uncharacterized protein n=1 Tax=Coniosporium apollinis TaxID=61459 RepID=A0ABQ9NJN2_9PEZI|nr:hypothetical protein H2201_008723 [Coniosporium apollinis]
MSGSSAALHDAGQISEEEPNTISQLRSLPGPGANLHTEDRVGLSDDQPNTLSGRALAQSPKSNEDSPIGLFARRRPFENFSTHNDRTPSKYSTISFLSDLTRTITGYTPEYPGRGLPVTIKDEDDELQEIDNLSSMVPDWRARVEVSVKLRKSGRGGYFAAYGPGLRGCQNVDQFFCMLRRAVSLKLLASDNQSDFTISAAFVEIWEGKRPYRRLIIKPGDKDTYRQLKSELRSNTGCRVQIDIDIGIKD